MQSFKLAIEVTETISDWEMLVTKMNKISLVQRNTTNIKSSVSRLVCSLFLLAFIFISCQGVLAEGAPIQVKIEDVDGDGQKDATIETAKARFIISSKTGSPQVLYLKGANFEENIIPPVIQDFGYAIASESIKPFTAEIRGLILENDGYNIELAEGNDDEVLIRATANISLVEAENDAPAVSFSKIYKFYNDSYHFEIEYVLTNLREKLVTIGDETRGGLALSYGPGLFMDPFGPSNMIGLKPGAIEPLADAQAANAAGSVAGAFNGIGLRDQYFCVLVETKDMARISASAYKFVSSDQKRKEVSGHVISCITPSFNLGARESRAFSFRVYAGPIILDELRRINRGEVSEYGFLSTILLRILQMFYALIPNYGLAIIFLTVVVRLALYPLTLKQTKSMAQMQKIQPKVQDLKDKHRDNPQKFNEEVLKLYQKHQVNPLGGCLPLLLQLPILIALYNTIRIAVELRKTPFLWIADLSKGDPLIILPIAIAALMYYQQGKMTDPSQQQMMAFMPIFMFVITWSLPAGLLVYWFASSVIGLFQQFQANRMAAALKEE